MDRHFYRCQTCLFPFAVELDGQDPKDFAPLCPVPHAGPHDLTIYMGRVSRRSRVLIRSQDVCPCDARCTHATGPACDCPCGGLNHGAGVTVTIDQATGETVPLDGTKASKTAEKNAQDWLDALDRLAPTLEALNRITKDLRNCKTWLDTSQYRKLCRAEDCFLILSDARRAKTQSSRLKFLRTLAEIAEKDIL